MYKYETHLHTYPVSKCAVAGVRETLEYYKSAGYEGVFITNHFLDGNINIDRDLPYEQKLEFYFSDYEEALSLSDEIGIKVFSGVELSYRGTDFLIYGLNEEWYFKHPEIMEMEKSEELPFMMEAGALVIQAHPFREAGYIDHIRLYPRCVHGVEIINAGRTDLANKMAKIYAEEYELIPFAGTDNHNAANANRNYAGILTKEPILNELHFVELVKSGLTEIFYDIKKVEEDK